MKSSYKISIQIGILTFICGVVFFIVSLYWYNKYISISEFLETFFIIKNLYLVVMIGIFALAISTVSHIFFSHLFSKVEQNNNKLKDYNHFLAHELKTPISVMYSNFEILKYGHDEKVVENSKKQLQGMIHIIDGLLNFSESLQVSEKKSINIENFIARYLGSFELKDNISIHNTSFNLTIHTDEVLFGRVVKNLVDNGLKYSLDKNLDIYIHEDYLRFENEIPENLSTSDLKNIQEKSFSKTFEEKRGHGIGLPMIQEIVKDLGYSLKVSSENKKFVVKISF